MSPTVGLETGADNARNSRPTLFVLVAGRSRGSHADLETPIRRAPEPPAAQHALALRHSYLPAVLPEQDLTPARLAPPWPIHLVLDRSDRIGLMQTQSPLPATPKSGECAELDRVDAGLAEPTPHETRILRIGGGNRRAAYERSNDLISEKSEDLRSGRPRRTWVIPSIHSKASRCSKR